MKKLWPLSEYETRQLNKTGSQIRAAQEEALAEAAGRSPQPSNNWSNGLLIDELLGPHDGPWRSPLL